MAGHSRARHAVRVPNGDRAAIHVQQLVRDAKLVAAVKNLDRKGFVQLPKADVVHLEVMPLQQLRNGEDRADAHLVRLTAGDNKAAIDAERLDIALLGELAVHSDAGRGAVGKLARIAGGYKAVLAESRVQGGNPFQRRARAV